MAVNFCFSWFFSFSQVINASCFIIVIFMYSLNFSIYQLLLLKLPKYGHDALNIRPPKLTDILEYTFCRVSVRKMDNKTIILLNLAEYSLILDKSVRRLLITIRRYSM